MKKAKIHLSSYYGWAGEEGGGGQGSNYPFLYLLLQVPALSRVVTTEFECSSN